MHTHGISNSGRVISISLQGPGGHDDGPTLPSMIIKGRIWALRVGKSICKNWHTLSMFYKGQAIRDKIRD